MTTQIQRQPNPVDRQVDAEHGASEAMLRKWIETSKKAEAKLDFNSKFREFNGHVNATWDSTHLYKDAISATTQFVPDNPPGFHGMFSQAMVGSTVPGRYTGEYRVIAVRTFNDNIPDAISDAANRPSANFTRMPEGLDDGGMNKDLVKALRKMMNGDKQKPQDKNKIDVKEFGKYRGWRATV